MTQTVGLYVHIPFCAAKCGYCDFYSLARQSDKLMDSYQKALLSHLKETAPFTAGYSVDTVYFGGGTPSHYGADRLAELLKTISKRFAISSLPEITAEANPESADYDTLKKLRKAGFNRLSIGVQALDDGILRDIGRIHDAKTAKAAVESAKRAGFENISVDLIFGLPGQTRQGFLDGVKEMTAMRPQHFSCYALKLSEECPMYAQREQLDFADDDEQAETYLEMVDELAKAGYEQYEISNFALKGCESRHNRKYWSLEQYLGFGPSAHSDFSKRRYSFVRDIEEYIAGVTAGDEVIDEYEELDMAERAMEYLMLGLRTSRGVSSNEYTRLFRASFDCIEEVLSRVAKHDLARPEGDRWRLTPRGFLVSNAIIGEILDHVQKVGEARG